MSAQRTESARILVVDDEPGFRRLLRRILSTAGYHVEEASTGDEAVSILRTRPFHLVVSDVAMPGMDGMALLTRVRRELPATRVVLVTAFGSVPGAVDAIRGGAFDYLTKPLQSPQVLLDTVRRALLRRSTALPGGPLEVPDRDALVYDCETMRKVVDMVRLVAPVDSTVLITGESGTGKELVARAIHALSPRARGPFVAVNCAALTDTLLDSELFGHERGAFTGAIERRIGKFEAAHEGTLFLDEVGEMSPALQVRLLRVLQERTFHRVGSTHDIRVDVRIIAATNRNLAEQVEQGRFRDDLYYRLAVVPIAVPPLRERGGDVVLLAEYFARVIAAEMGRTPPSLDRGARARLRSYGWPGNVRELRNVIERALILSEGPVITSDDLVFDVPVGPSQTAAGDTLPLNLKALEEDAIRRALARCGGNRRKAAELLGIGLRTLQYKIKEYGMK